jgi:hypothetical protein
MFTPRMIDGVQVLFRQRLADDWSKLQSIREAKKRGAEARWDGERMHMHSTADALHSTAMQGSKEVSEVSKEVIKNTERTQKARDCDLPGFRIFWHAYPNQIDEPAALRQWLSKVRDDGNWSEVLAGLEKWKSSGNWDDPQFIPNPARFLYEKRWQREPPVRRENVRTPRQQKSKATATALSRVLGGSEIRDGAHLGNYESGTKRIADHGVRGGSGGDVNTETSRGIQESEKDITVLP